MNNKGSTTIETAYIIPVCLVCTLLIFFIGILLYDRTCICFALKAALLRGSESSELDNDKLSDQIVRDFKSFTKGRLPLAKGSINVEVTYSKITASFTGSLDAPKLPLSKVLASHIQWDLSQSSSVERLRRSRLIRSAKRIRRIMKGKE